MIFIHIGQPADNARIWARLHPLRYDIGVEQEAHNSISRGGSCRRSTLKSDSRSGEAANHSARLPVRLVFRSHSSAATITTAGRPFRVIICGPSDRARSMTSLNFALASATVQVSTLLPPPTSIRLVILVILVSIIGRVKIRGRGH